MLSDVEKEFIPYDRALKMKALGFDEPCFGMYCEGRFHLLYPNSYKDIPEDFYREVDAPTFSQTFRWFREKYSYDISIVRRTVKAYQFEIQKLVYEGDDYFFNDFSFDTYEEAELACIDKLIEIVEQKA